jgi:DNA replication protein DnaC
MTGTCFISTAGKLERASVIRFSNQYCGKSSTGKTGLATGILLKAFENGYRGQFIQAQDLFDEMYASLADRSSRRLLNRLVKLDVLL